MRIVWPDRLQPYTHDEDHNTRDPKKLRLAEGSAVSFGDVLKLLFAEPVPRAEQLSYGPEKTTSSYELFKLTTHQPNPRWEDEVEWNVLERIVTG